MAGYAPLRTQKKGGIDDFLAFYLPEMLKQKMQLDQVKKQAEIWLQNQLKEYEAYGEIQSKQGNEAFIRETLGKLFDPRYVEKLPGPTLKMAQSIRDYAPELFSRLGITIPVGEEDVINKAVLGYTDIIDPRRTLDEFPSEQIAPALRTFGESAVLEAIKQKRSEKEKAAEIGIRGKELDATLKGLGLRAEELGVRGAELEAEKPAGKKALAAKLEKRMGEVNDYVDKYLGVTSGMIGELKINKPQTLGQIERVMADIKQLRKSLGIKQTADINTIVSRLKNAGYTKESFLENVQARTAFINLGIDPLILLEYLPSAKKKK